MFRTRSRKILRDILSRKFRTVMVSTSIFVGVLGVVALTTTNDLLVSTLEDDLRQDELAMINVSVTAPVDATLDNETYLAMLNQENELGQRLDVLDGIERVEGVARYPVAFKKSGAASYEDGYLKAYSVLLQDRQLEPLQLTDGAWPVAGQHQIALEKRMAREFGFAVGDTIIFRTVSAAGLGDVEYTVTGLVYHPYILDPETFPEDSIYAQYADAQAILGLPGYNVFAVRYEDFELAEAHFKDIQGVINDHTPYFPVYALMEDPADSRIVRDTKSTGAVLSLLAMVAMVVAGFLVVNVINSIVVEQKKQIGTIKSMGGTRVDNFFIFAGMALVYGVIGTVPGVLLGIPLGFQMAQAMGKEFSILIDEFAWSPTAVVIGVLMGLAVPVLAAVIPVYNGTRVTIREAMSDFGISSTYGQGRLARLVGWLPVPISVRQAFSNTLQKRGRLALTGITLTLAIGAFMGVLAVTVSVIDEVNAIFGRMNYQIVAVPNETQDQAAYEARVAAVEGVQLVSPLVYVMTQIDGDYTNFFTSDNQIETLGVDTTADLFNFQFTSGTGWQDDPNREGVVIASPMAGQLGIQAGDDLTFWVSGQRVTLPVIGVDRAAFDFMYMEWQQLAQLAGLTGETEADVGPVPNAYSITIAEDDPSSAEVDVVMERLDESLLAAGIGGNYTNQIAEAEFIVSFISVFQTVLVIAAALIAMVGAIGLLTTLSMNVFERQKEIGVMRSIGAGSLTIVTQFLSEGLLVGLAAWVIGLPISYFLAMALNAAFNVDTLEFRYPLIIPVFGLVSMVAITLISSIGPSLGAARKTVSDILRYQ